MSPVEAFVIGIKTFDRRSVLIASLFSTNGLDRLIFNRSKVKLQLPFDFSSLQVTLIGFQKVL